MAPNPRRQDEKLDALYAEVPEINCKGLCSDSCGPIEMSLRERERIERSTGREVTCGSGADCSMLTADRRCGVYAIRPMICRLWGVSAGMTCPYGCKPERLLSRVDGAELLGRADQIGGDPGGREAKLDREIKRLRERPDLEKLLAKIHQHPTLGGRNMPRTMIDQTSPDSGAEEGRP